MPQIAQAGAIYASQLFWLFVVFAAIYLVIGRGMVPRIERTIEDRDARVAADLAAAEAARTTARQADERYAGSTDGARGQAVRLVGEAQAKAAAAAEAALKASAAHEEQVMAEATQRIDAAKVAAFGEIETTTVDAVEAIVAKLSGITPDRALVVDRVKAELTHG